MTAKRSLRAADKPGTRLFGAPGLVKDIIQCVRCVTAQLLTASASLGHRPPTDLVECTHAAKEFGVMITHCRS